MNPLFNTSGYTLKDGELRLLQKESWAVVRLSEVIKVKKPTLTSAVIRLTDGRRITLDLSHLSTAAFTEVNGAIEDAARHHRSASIKLPEQLGHDPLMRELKAALRALDALPLKTKEDLEHWYKAADAFRGRLNSEWESISAALPHELEHYLCDADIREKDPIYTGYQRKLLSALLVDAL